MNLDSLSLALSQISYLVDNLTKKNYRASQQEIQHVSKVAEESFLFEAKQITKSGVWKLFGVMVCLIQKSTAAAYLLFQRILILGCFSRMPTRSNLGICLCCPFLL
uniref:Uncharacterized protein n=1 Tax=Ornithorhynchus anatinus TaxID=9258 RepID=A0A6I8MY72_ORNAN